MWVGLGHFCLRTVRGGVVAGPFGIDAAFAATRDGRVDEAPRPRITARLAVGHGGSGSDAVDLDALHPRALRRVP